MKNVTTALLTSILAFPALAADNDEWIVDAKRNFGRVLQDPLGNFRGVIAENAFMVDLRSRMKPQALSVCKAYTRFRCQNMVLILFQGLSSLLLAFHRRPAFQFGLNRQTQPAMTTGV